MSWYRTHRPRHISDLHLQRVRDTFHTLLKQGKLPQVMLFAGPKGTGKTTTARIIAAIANDPRNYPVIEHLFFKKPAPSKILLQEPDLQNSDLDAIFTGRSFLVQELDAASNRGIDDVRAIKERINIPPPQGLMTVYILDEAHMLTTEAFNALLKLLEEPPAHVLFILATTELHKVPETIKSRATLIEFTKATPAEITVALEKVFETEKIEFEADALSILATVADGSFRDAVKLAETLAMQQTKLTKDFVESQLTQGIASFIPELLTAVIDKKADQVMQLFQTLRNKNVDPHFFTKQLVQFLHRQLLIHTGVESGQKFSTLPITLFLLQGISTVTTAPQTTLAFLPLELKLLDLIFRSQDKAKKQPAGGDGQSQSVSAPAPQPSKAKPVELAATAPADTIMTARPVGAAPTIDSLDAVVDTVVSVSEGDAQKLLEQWQQFIDLVHGKNSSLGALLRSAQPLNAESGKATIAVFYKFHKEQLQQPKFLRMLDECLVPVAGGQIKLEFVLRDAPPAMTQVEESTSTTNEQTLARLAEELLV